jgi:hypothetical protein
MVDWKIYYHDGSTFDSDDGSPDDAPAYGVLSVLHRVPFEDRERNEFIIYGDFYYYITGDRWYGGDDYGLREHLRDHTPLEGVCQGRLIDFEAFNNVMKIVKRDSDFPDAVG